MGDWAVRSGIVLTSVLKRAGMAYRSCFACRRQPALNWRLRLGAGRAHSAAVVAMGIMMAIRFITGHNGRGSEIEALFTDVFTASEGADEGRLVGSLVRGLMETTPDEDLYVFSAMEENTLLGCIFLSRLRFDQDERQVFILSPVAVSTKHQRSGVGQALIHHGLDQLRAAGVDFVVTYGDPGYYCKTGFQPITEAFARAPLRLSHPHGWIGQPLSARGDAPLQGASRCVPALNQPALW